MINPMNFTSSSTSSSPSRIVVPAGGLQVLLVETTCSLFRQWFRMQTICELLITELESNAGYRHFKMLRIWQEVICCNVR